MNRKIKIAIILVAIAPGLMFLFDNDFRMGIISIPFDLKNFIDTMSLHGNVRDFIDTLNLPDLRILRAIAQDEKYDMRVFKFRYGMLQDCMAGCFSSSGMGLQYKDNVGLIELHDYDNHNISQDHFYKLQDDESFLLSNESYDIIFEGFVGEKRDSYKIMPSYEGEKKELVK